MARTTGGPSWPERLSKQEQRASVAERTNANLVAVLRRIANEGDARNGEVSAQAKAAGLPESWAARLASASLDPTQADTLRRERDDAHAVEVDRVEAERDEAREVLTAIRELAQRARAVGAAPDYDDERIQDALWAVADAALARSTETEPA